MKTIRAVNVDEGSIDERVELYYRMHPRSPSAVHRPEITKRGLLWVALLGPSIENGIVGIGASIEMALRTFDVQYVHHFQPIAA